MDSLETLVFCSILMNALLLALWLISEKRRERAERREERAIRQRKFLLKLIEGKEGKVNVPK